MKALWNLIRHKYLRIPAIISLVLIIVLPVFIFVSRQEQDPRSSANVGTTLSFSPTTSKSRPIVKNIGDEFYIDVIVNPTNNLVSILKLDIRYDPNIIKISNVNPFEVNSVIFPSILEGPIYSDGRIQVALSVGPDLTKAIANEQRVATIYFNAITTTNRTIISFGDNNVAYSVAVEDSIGENVISNLIPAYVKIQKDTGNTKENPGNGKKPND